MSEEWRPVYGNPRYLVSRSGQVKNAKTNRHLTPHPNTSGYPKVSLRLGGESVTRSIHTLVAEAFLGPRPVGYEPNHKDTVKSNNHVDNLEWVTHKENMEHASKSGRLYGRGGGSPKVKIQIVETGEVFDSIAECARHIEGQTANIYKYLEGVVKHHKGYTFRRL